MAEISNGDALDAVLLPEIFPLIADELARSGA
jgi:hypothetical protein